MIFNFFLNQQYYTDGSKQEKNHEIMEMMEMMISEGLYVYWSVNIICS